MQNVDLDDPNLDEREKVIAALEQAGLGTGQSRSAAGYDAETDRPIASRR